MGDRVRIHARLTYRGALLAEQDRHFGHLVRQIGDEEWLLDVMCPVKEWRWAVKFFYSLALDAEVLEPVQLREEIRRMADEVRERYDRDPDTNLEKERRS
jgi:predicted DNA-binding transcriptional regulator YafY